MAVPPRAVSAAGRPGRHVLEPVASPAVQDFAGKIAVVTGGGSGMGRELVVQLSAAGAHVSTCDLSEDAIAETAELARAAAPSAEGRVSTHHCDVSDEDAVLRFRDEVLAGHDSEHVNLLFNNAGISGGGSLIADSREAWDRCFAVCWGGVYHGVRAFLPALIAADEGHIVNISSVNGFWASVGPDRPHTAYSAAKFAVRGLSEAMITDLRVHAPHVGVSVVMPGHIGTSIVENSLRHGARRVGETEAAVVAAASRQFRDSAPVTAAEAATVILDGVLAGRWRILVGDDAHAVDAAVRADPESAYEPGSPVAAVFAAVVGAARRLPDDA